MEPAPEVERTVFARAIVSLVGERTGKVILPVQGWSMGHALGPEAEVVVKPLTAPPRFGDVVVAEGVNGFFVHRVIGAVRGAPPLLITKGDNCYEADLPVPPGKLIGRVEGIRKNGRIRMPWHWRAPLSLVVGFLSRLEAGGYPLVSYSIRKMNFRVWRVRMKIKGIEAIESNCNHKGEKHE